MNPNQSPVSPIELQPLPPTNQPVPSTQPASSSPHTPTKEGWLPFTLRWYYLVVPILLSLLLGSILVYLTIYSSRNYGLGADNGSSAILFGWRFTPTLVAVLYAQMTVILFEDAKRTEPFARLAKAPAGGASAYGTLLQTPRAWWSILIDVCFRRKKMGHTSWSLVCAALANVLALLAISPLSSALLTSEEVLVPKSVEFARMVLKLDTQLPMVPTRETYYRTMNALFRNVSTSAWLSDTNLTFPYWPAHEPAQFGPTLKSSYGAWEANTTTLESRYECQDMKLESADLVSRQFSGVYTTQNYGPLNGTQPMVTFVLTSTDGCKYEVSVHPAADLASNGGVTWSNATNYYLTGSGTMLPIGGRPYRAGVSPTHIYARLNASEKCNGRDIIIMSSAWTVPFQKLPGQGGNPMIPTNQTYERSSDFRMRGLLCDSQYYMSNQSIKATIPTSSQQTPDSSTKRSAPYQKIPENMIDIAGFQAMAMLDTWKTYIDEKNMFMIPTGSGSGIFPGFSGMAPILATPYKYNVTAMLDDTNIAQRAASIKGRFFMETMREAFDSKESVGSDTVAGAATMIENRVVVLTEIGITLAVLFFVSAISLILVFWSSRLSIRPLNLRSDPASAVGLALLMKRRNGGLSALKSMHGAPRTDFYTALQDENYFTVNGTLLKGDSNTEPPIKIKTKSWRPHVIRARTLLALGLLLTSILVAILTLNAFSARSQLSQLAFIYEADVSKFGLSFSAFAPISIAPTLTSIIVGLWWDQLDMTWRILQPFISMSQGPTPICSGAGLTYRSKSWIGAAIKSGRRKHWVLFMITLGSVVAQVLTVSMSALFERQSHAITKPVKLQQALEIRQVPLINEVESDIGSGETPAMLVLDKLYLDTANNWLYGASVQQSSNGSQLPWTSGGWSFLPVDLSNISDQPEGQNVTNRATNDATTSLTSANVTLQVPAIRARLECSVVEEVANVSSWATLQSLDPKKDGLDPNAFARVNSTGEVKMYALGDYIFAGTDAHTTTLSSPKSATCCQNGSIQDPQQAVIGYWSPVLPPNASRKNGDGAYPYDMLSWPLSLTTKWIVGRSISFPTTDKVGALYFKEAPKMQAAQCKPIIETAGASIVVDRYSSQVYSAAIDPGAVAAPEAWSDVFTRHDITGRKSNGTFSSPTQNITTSFGILFVEALLGLSDRRHTVGVSYTESTEENAFVFRDHDRGINMDLMTYSMYTLAEKDPEALLNYTTLTEHADRTFQTFFQHFVNSGLSTTKGGYAYQPINDNSMETLGGSIDEDGKPIAEKTFTKTNTNRTIDASVTQRIRVLHINTVATYLSTALLIWLIFTTIIVLCVQRRYTRFMHRDVQLIADMLVLIAGSDNLLDLVEEKSVELKRNRGVKTMLGWFRDRDGQVRWGVEVVGGRHAVDWVDAPKQGFHVPCNTTSGRRSKLLAWRPWRTS